jgi:bloom syndrome protein
MPDVYAILRDVFRHDAFKEEQKNVIDAILEGKDVFLTSATGSGKSLCYQLPAYCSLGVAVVISPLTSLIQDQHSKLVALGIPMLSLWNGQVHGDRRKYDDLLSTDCKEDVAVKVLLSTPEAFSNDEKLRSALQSLDDRSLVSMIVFDEAHCIRSWGPKFRTVYKEFAKLRGEWGIRQAPILCLTATITTTAMEKTIAELGMRDVKIVIGKLKRPNIFYDVIKKTDSGTKYLAREIMIRYFASFNNESGIVYCASPAECDALVEDVKLWLQEHQRTVSYAVYYSTSDGKQGVFDSFMNGKTKVLFATNAFGMGVDKKGMKSMQRQRLKEKRRLTI